MEKEFGHSVRRWQERLFELRAEADRALKDASHLLELAALGGKDAGEKALTAAARISLVNSSVGSLLNEIKRHSLFMRNPVTN